jgi:hypothetical protein
MLEGIEKIGFKGAKGGKGKGGRRCMDRKALLR